MFKRLIEPVDKRLTVFGLILIGLTLLDVFATLRHLEHGADEINPFMNALLGLGAYAFFAYKYIATALGILLILAHPEPRRVEVVIWILMPVYLLLGLYQVALFAVPQ